MENPGQEPPLWLGNSPKGILQSDETHTGPIEGTGSETDPVPRRHTGVSRFSEKTISPPPDSQPTEETQFYPEPEEMPTEPITDNRILGIYSQLEQPDTHSIRGQSEEHQEGMLGGHICEKPSPPR